MNDIIDNTYQVYFRGTVYPNSWDNGTFGNYWSDYNGTDSNGDGIGDIPYYINDGNIDNHPLMFGFETYYGAPTITNVAWSPRNPLPTEHVYVIADVTDTNDVSKVLLYYKVGSSDWTWTEMTLLENGSYYGGIPPFSSNTVVLFKIVANDTFGNTAESDVYSYTAVDTEPPTISNITCNPLEPIHNESVTVTAHINDSGGVDTVILSYIHGELRQWNNVTMSLINGVYVGMIPAYLETTLVQYRIYANDTAGNLLVSELYSYTVIDVNPPVINNVTWVLTSPSSSDNVTVYVNTSDPSGISTVILSYTSDIGWLNVSMTYENGLYVATIPAFSVSTLVQFLVTVNDTVGNRVESEIYSYTVSDSNPPQITNVVWSPTEPLYNESITVVATITDESDIARVLLAYQVGNSTLEISMSILGKNYQATIPEQPENTTVVFWIYSEDAYGNTANSSFYQYTVPDITPPFITNIQQNPTQPKAYVSVTIKASVVDNVSIDSVWLNYSLDVTHWYVVAMNLNGNVFAGMIPPQPEYSLVTFVIYANGTSGNVASSAVLNYTVVDSTSPSINGVAWVPMTPNSEENVLVYANISDEHELAIVLLSYYNGAYWVNVSMSLFNESYVGVIPALSAGTTVQFKIYAQDNYGNWGVSTTYSYTIIPVGSTNTSLNSGIDPVITIGAIVAVSAAAALGGYGIYRRHRKV